MTSEAWGLGLPDGDSGAPDGGTVGDSAVAIRKGSGWALLQWSSALLALGCVAIAVATLQANGLLVLASIFAATYIWSVGAHQSTYWLR